MFSCRRLRGFEAIRLFHERASTVPLIAISGYAFAEWDNSAPEFLRLATRLGATRCLRKPFKPATLLGVIDECLRDAEPHRRQIATLGAVTGALAEAPGRVADADANGEAPARAKHLGGRLS